MGCTEEQRAVILLLCSEGENIREINGTKCQFRISIRPCCISERKVYEWMEKFEELWPSITENASSVRPQSVTCVEDR
jgi:hypothetical protein